MGYCRQTALPASEPLSLGYAKNYLRIDPNYIADDELITGMISAAREHAELLTGRAIAQRTFRMVLDSAPYYTDTIQSQLAYPPSYYSLPLYSTTLWNYSQMIKLPFPPVVSVQQMRYIDTDGNAQTLAQDTGFVLDRITEPCRIFPLPGQYWPPNLYVANALEIDFTAGYVPTPLSVDTHTVAANPPNQQPDSIIVTGIPHRLRNLLMKMVANWYQTRTDSVDDRINLQLQSMAVVDWAPTRG